MTRFSKREIKRALDSMDGESIDSGLANPLIAIEDTTVETSEVAS